MSFEYLLKRAEQGDAHALNRIGCLYYNKNNHEEAFKYFLLSAEQKYNDAYVSVAYCYKNGIGVKKDLKKALEYWHLSGIRRYIDECELLILNQFSKTLDESDYLYAYPLYIKHNHKDLGKLKTLIHKKYIEAMHFIPPVLSDIIISFLL